MQVIKQNLIFGESFNHIILTISYYVFLGNSATVQALINDPRF